ncbi:MAG: FkbM family methyltransferase, partial [Lentisphaerota bacterium]
MAPFFQMQKVMGAARRMARRMPLFIQQRLKKMYYPWWIRRHAETAWPPWEGVKRLLPAGSLAIDVGANMGYVTYLLARQVGPTGKVLSLEPVREVFGVLRSNMRRLRLHQVEVFNCAASSADGTGLMTIPEYADGGRNYYEAHIVSPSALGPDVIPDVRLSRL